MSITQPLGVRIYNTTLSFDQYITNTVSDLSFRSTAPGGFASATIKVRRNSPVNAPDSQKWNVPTSSASADNSSFKVTDANASNVAVGDRFWAYTTGGAVRFNGARFTVSSKSSSGGITTVGYFPASSAPIASGETVLCKAPSYFFNGSLQGYNKWILMFNRIQIVDLRTMEIVWEGRIEDPARETEKNTWTLGALGNSVFATDITAPVWYLDSDVNSWLAFAFTYSGIQSIEEDQDAQSITISLLNGDGNGFAAQSWEPAARFLKYNITKQYLGRFDGIYNGSDTTATQGRLALDMDFFPNNFNNATYPLNGAENFHFARVVGTNFTDGTFLAQVEVGNRNTTSSVTTTAGCKGILRLPRVQAQRMDRWRTLQNTGASYPDGALRVYQVVEDVLGRFLNGGHSSSGSDIPFWGYVSPYTSYVDTSNTVLMVDGWTFYDGTTAKDILDKLCDEAQTNGFWAIWESGFGATDDGFDAKARFEFTNWPNSWGYEISSQDGLAEQPDGSVEYNYVWYVWQNSDETSQPYNVTYCQQYWNSSPSSDINYSGITRGMTVKRGSGATDSDTVFNEAGQWITDNSRGTNSGSVTVKRPIMYYDRGDNSKMGGARRLDPWMIRPGKVARIYDLLPRAMMGSMPYGATLPNRILDDVLFRVTATEWSSSDGSCKLDLDQIASWDISTQIVVRGGKTKQIVVYK